MKLAAARRHQHQRSEIRRGREIQPAIHRQALEALHHAALAALPGRAADERRGCLNPLVEDQIPIFGLARRHALGVGRHRQHFLRVEEIPNAGFAALIAASLNGSRSSPALYSDSTTRGSCAAAASSISTDEQIAIGRRLRADDDRQRIVVRPDRRLQRLIQRRARPLHLAELVMHQEARRQPESRAGVSAQRLIERAKARTENLL